MDTVDRTLLAALQENARISTKDLASKVRLSAPATAERLRKLQEAGVIEAFTALLDTKALGYHIEAIVRIRPLPGKLHVVEALLRDMPQVAECDKVTGDDGFVARILCHSIEHLDELFETLGEKAETSSAIVKRKIVSRRQPALADEK